LHLPLVVTRRLLQGHLAIMAPAVRLDTILRAMPAYLQAAQVLMHFLIQVVEVAHQAIIPLDLVALLPPPHHAGHFLMAVAHAHPAIIPLEKAA
jgi:hypothetical protein